MWEFAQIFERFELAILAIGVGGVAAVLIGLALAAGDDDDRGSQ